MLHSSCACPSLPSSAPLPLVAAARTRDGAEESRPLDDVLGRCLPAAAAAADAAEADAAENGDASEVGEFGEFGEVGSERRESWAARSDR